MIVLLNIYLFSLLMSQFGNLSQCVEVNVSVLYNGGKLQIS
jgi:hypothetical protein